MGWHKPDVRPRRKNRYAMKTSVPPTPKVILRAPHTALGVGPCQGRLQRSFHQQGHVPHAQSAPRAALDGHRRVRCRRDCNANACEGHHRSARRQARHRPRGPRQGLRVRAGASRRRCGERCRDCSQRRARPTQEQDRQQERGRRQAEQGARLGGPHGEARQRESGARVAVQRRRRQDVDGCSDHASSEDHHLGAHAREHGVLPAPRDHQDRS